MAHNRPMTPKQLRKLLDEAGLSQSEAARRLGIGPRTMRRHVSAADTKTVPRIVELAVRYIAEHQEDAK
jgi:predicted DNA-binding protein (UPF0251 family)